jgi:hypothetical protein
MSFSFRLGLLILFAVLSLFSWSHCDGGPERTECTSIIDIQMSHNGHTFPHTHTLFTLFFLQFPHLMKKEQSQTLRSALQQKAKNQPPSKSSGGKAKRKFKPGQAKTLSDLPQLSA